MVSLRNDRRRKRKVVRIPSLTNSQDIGAENGEEVLASSEKIDGQVGNIPVRVGDEENAAVGDIGPKGDETRVSDKIDSSNNVNKSLDDTETKPTVLDSKEGKRMPSLQCSGADDDEDNIPIGRVLIRKKTGGSLKRKRESFDDDDNNNSNNHNFKDAMPGKRSAAQDKEKPVKVQQTSNAYGRSPSQGFQEGDMVWAKVKSHPWWPGQIYNPAFASSTARRSRKPGHMLVAFFGDSSYGWFLESDLIPFEPNYTQKSKQSTSRNFSKAVDEAVDEVSRRAALGLMCACQSPNSFKPASRQGYVAVNVKGYEMGGVYTNRQIDMARNDFQPGRLVSFVRRMATSPWSGEEKGILGIQSIAEVVAYRDATLISMNRDYLEILRNPTSFHAATATHDTWDRSELGFEAFGRDSIIKPLAKDDKKYCPRHAKATKSIMQGKTIENKDKYLFKRRDRVGEHRTFSSKGHIMNPLVQANDLKIPVTNIEALDEEGYETDGIGKYVFQKRVCSEDAQVIETEKEREQEEKGLFREGSAIRESGARKKEAVRKAFHMRVSDTENELDKSTCTSRKGETKIQSEVSLISEISSPNLVCFNELDDISSLNDLLGSNISRVEAGKRLTSDISQVGAGKMLPKDLQKKRDKKTALIGNSSIEHASLGEAVEAERKGIMDDKLSEEMQCVAPDTKFVDNVNTEGHSLRERPAQRHKRLSDVSSVPETEVINKLNEVQNTHTSLVGGKGLFSASDTEQGSEASLATIKTQELGMTASERMGNVIVDDKCLSDNTDAPVCNVALLNVKEDPAMGNNTQRALENDGKNHPDSVCLYDGVIESQISTSAEMDKTGIFGTSHIVSPVSGIFDLVKGSQKDSLDGREEEDNIRLSTETGRADDELAVVSADVNKTNCNFTPNSQSTPSLDHAIIKKTKGFKRLVKFAKSSGLDDTRDNGIYLRKQNHLSDAYVPCNQQPAERQCNVTEGVQSSAEPHEDVKSGGAGVHTISPDYRRDEVAENDQGCSSKLRDQVQSDKCPPRDVDPENSGAVLYQLLGDLLSLALDPFFGVERDCPSKVCQAFLRFRSAVYQKSLSLHSSSEVSKNGPSLSEVEDEQETKNKLPSRESELALPLSDNKDVNVEDLTSNGTACPESGEVATLTNSKGQPYPQVLKIAKGRSLEAEILAKEARKRKSDVQSDGSRSLKRLRKLKDLKSVDSLKSGLKQSVKKLSGIPRRDLRESVPQFKKARHSSAVQPLDSRKTLEEPMALCMKFPEGFALPSEVQLKARFARFGPLDISGTRIYCKSGSAQVVFKHSSDAETAYKYATENCLFGQADVHFRLKQIFHTKKETSALQNNSEPLKLLKIRNEKVIPPLPDVVEEDFPLLKSLDMHGVTEALAESTSKSILQSRPIVQLKSCLKKPDESGNNTVKETARVTFLLDSEEFRPEQDIAMDGPSRTENNAIPVSISIPFENDASALFSLENNGLEPDPPDISYQMLHLLKKCSDIVTDIRSTLGYVPYLPL